MMWRPVATCYTPLLARTKPHNLIVLEFCRLFHPPRHLWADHISKLIGEIRPPDRFHQTPSSDIHPAWPLAGPFDSRSRLWFHRIKRVTAVTLDFLQCTRAPRPRAREPQEVLLGCGLCSVVSPWWAASDKILHWLSIMISEGALPKLILREGRHWINLLCFLKRETVSYTEGPLTGLMESTVFWIWRRILSVKYFGLCFQCDPINCFVLPRRDL